MKGSSSYRLARERLSLPHLSMLLSEFYSKTELMRALRRGGFYLKGTRLNGLALHELADFLAEGFLDQPDVGVRIAAHLDEATADIKAEAMAVSPSRFTKSLGPVEEALGQGKVHGALWVLATDERVEARRALERLMAKLDRLAEKTLRVIERFESEFQGTWDEGDVPRIAEIDQQAAEAARRADRAEREANRRDKKLKALREKRQDQARQIASLEEERARLRKENAALKSEGQALARKLEKLEKSRPALKQFEQRNREAEKEMARVRHELDQARRFLEERHQARTARLEETERELSELTRRHEEALARAERERFTYEAVTGDLRAEVGRLRARLTKERERRQPQERARQYREQRVGIFLDVSNLYISGLEYYRRQIDYGRLTETALNGRVLATALAYNVDSAWGDKSAFYDVLRGIGYEIRTKELVVRADGSKKGDWDVGIAADVIERLDRLDVVVLGSGDGDFLPVVRKAKARGVAVEVYAFPNTAVVLKEEADYYPIDESLLKEEVSRFARPAGAMGKNDLLQAISEALGAPAGFLGKLSVAELERLLRSLKSLSG